MSHHNARHDPYGGLQGANRRAARIAGSTLRRVTGRPDWACRRDAVTVIRALLAGRDPRQALCAASGGLLGWVTAERIADVVVRQARHEWAAEAERRGAAS